MIVNFQIKEKDRLSKENEEVGRQERIVRDIERRAAARHIKGAEWKDRDIDRQTNWAKRTKKSDARKGLYAILREERQLVTSKVLKVLSAKGEDPYVPTYIYGLY